MALIFVDRSQAKRHLQGARSAAVGIQTTCALIELSLIVAQGYGLTTSLAPVLFPLSVGIDLFLLTPLKVGRALYFETRVTEPQAARFSQLFHFYRTGYRRCIAWRFSVWCIRFGLTVLFCVPCAILLLVTRMAAQSGAPTVAVVSFLLSLCLLVLALLLTEVLLFRYIPSVYLLIHVRSARSAMRLSRRITKRTSGLWAQLFLNYAGYCFTFPLVFPFFYVSALFQTARAALTRQLILQNTAEIREHLLQPR